MSASSRLRLLPPGGDLGWTPYVWLIYLPVFLVPPLLGRPGAATWLAYVAGAVVLAATYFRGHWVHGSALVRIIVTQVALGVIFAADNAGAFVFFTYAASFAARLEPRRAAFAWIGAITAAGLTAAFVTGAPPWTWFAYGLVTPLIGAVVYHQTQVSRANAHLRAAHGEIEHLATVAERERIARDLHDVLGHTLSLIVLKAELASRLVRRDPGRAAAEVRDVEAVARNALQEVRQAIRGYRPTLAAELTRARVMLEAAHIGATIDADVRPDELHARDGAEEALALAVREAVTNIVRHSRASSAHIRAWCDAPAGRVILEVSDDGCGLGEREGTGLRGMRERVTAVNGTLHRSTGRGTSLAIVLPLGAGAASGAATAAAGAA